MSQKWGAELTAYFVEEYGKKSCLWDTSCPEYKSKQAREAALREIVDKIGIDGFDEVAAKKKIRILRSTYWNERAKMQKSERTTGTSAYRPKIPWFYIADQFLRGVTNWKDANSNSSVCEYVPCEELDGAGHNSHVDGAERTRSPGLSILPNKRSSTLSPSVVVPPIRSRKRIRKKSLDCERETAQGSREALQSSIDEDEFDAFGRSMSLQLKKMPLPDALELQAEIQYIVSVKRIQILNRTTTSSTSTSFEEDEGGFIM